MGEAAANHSDLGTGGNNQQLIDNQSCINSWPCSIAVVLANDGREVRGVDLFIFGSDKQLLALALLRTRLALFVITSTNLNI